MATQTLTQKQTQEFLDRDLEQQAKQAISSSSPAWQAVEKALAWIRDVFKSYLNKEMSKLPVVGVWAGRIGTTVADLIFTVIGTTLNFLKIAVSSPKLWSQAHEVAMTAWTANDKNGLVAQTYAYAKKMTAYFLKVVKECLIRAIVANGFEVSQAEKDDISDTLDALLNKV